MEALESAIASRASRALSLPSTNMALGRKLVAAGLSTSSQTAFDDALQQYGQVDRATRTELFERIRQHARDAAAAKRAAAEQATASFTTAAPPPTERLEDPLTGLPAQGGLLIRAGQSRHALALHEAWLAPTLGPKFFGHAARALQKGVTGAAGGGGTDDLRRPQEGPAAAAARSICAEKVGLDALRRIERLSGRGLAGGDGSRQQQVKAWRHQSAYVLALARVQLVCPSSSYPCTYASTCLKNISAMGNEFVTYCLVFVCRW